jgi:peptidoglycan/LPS O-acetylase OafA/YrhL
MLRNKITYKTCGVSILQRALRIWPTYILSMMFFSSLYMKMSCGPFWQQMQGQTDLCARMWREIFFMANFVDNGAGGCLSWGWYLQVDFQLFVIGIILLLAYGFRKWLFYTVVRLLMIGSMVFQFAYIQASKITIFTDL